jgi:hypothetical protein
MEYISQGHCIGTSHYVLAYFPKVGLRYRHAVCVSVNPHYYLLNARTNLYETWYVYHGP